MRIISGGQTGSDIAGLKAAKICGLETGGTLPKGCITLDGPKPEYLIEYDMREFPTHGYPARTEANVKNSDATLRFASNFKSAGEKCTLKAIKWFNRPYLDIDVKNPKDPAEVREWLESNNVEILNVAGNSEQTSPGIEEFVTNYLIEVFKKP